MIKLFSSTLMINTPDSWPNTTAIVGDSGLIEKKINKEFR